MLLVARLQRDAAETTHDSTVQRSDDAAAPGDARRDRRGIALATLRDAERRHDFSYKLSAGWVGPCAMPSIRGF
jgi:hypothetical protein